MMCIYCVRRYSSTSTSLLSHVCVHAWMYGVPPGAPTSNLLQHIIPAGAAALLIRASVPGGGTHDEAIIPLQARQVLDVTDVLRFSSSRAQGLQKCSRGCWQEMVEVHLRTGVKNVKASMGKQSIEMRLRVCPTSGSGWPSSALHMSAYHRIDMRSLHMNIRTCFNIFATSSVCPVDVE